MCRIDIDSITLVCKGMVLIAAGWEGQQFPRNNRALQRLQVPESALIGQVIEPLETA
jgi:hypothetical protein